MFGEYDGNLPKEPNDRFRLSPANPVISHAASV
jgi:hypothetical protein